MTPVLRFFLFSCVAWGTFVALFSGRTVYAEEQDLTGAGSSFAAPLYGAWGILVHERTAISLNYQSVGSGAGLNQIVAGTVDFGASDKPAPASVLAVHHLYQFPTALGAIVFVVNLPGLAPGSLKLDGPTLAALYDGRITEWNDPAIQVQNPGMTLPDLDVAPLHRADSSGTSFVVTSYFSNVSPEWKEHYGAGTSVAWSVGAGARGNDGVAASVRETIGGIGYLEYAYASRNHLPMIQLKARDGAYVSPTSLSFADAAAHADWQGAKNHVVDLLNRHGQQAWPIMSATYAVVPLDRRPTARLFFETALHDGAAEAIRLDYIPIPKMVREAILRDWPR